MILIVVLLLLVQALNRASVVAVSSEFSFPGDVYYRPEVYIDRLSSFDRWTSFWAKEPNRNGRREKCTTPTRKRGLCESIYDCGSMISFLNDRLLTWEERNFLRLSVCTGAASGRPPFVCCPDKANKVVGSTPTAPPPVVVTDPPVPQAAAGGRLPNPAKYECGSAIGMRIYGGENVDIDEFPWLALLEYKNHREERKFSCGGSLVNNRYVLTAAHCVVGEVEKKEGELISVRLGEYDLTKEHDCIVQDGEEVCTDPPINVPVKEKLVHPEYSEATHLNDIALLRLDRNIEYTDFVQPVCLPLADFRSSVAGDINFVTGFGRTLQNKKSDIKQKLGIKVYDQDRCREKFSTKNGQITPKQLCAGGEFAKDACHGDSGGPLMKLRKVWTLEGIVSYGNRCGLEDWPGVYTRVLAYMDWIRASIRD